jgi:hypothetical protein
MNIVHIYWLLSFICSYFLSIGVFGYGVDYYAIYHKSIWGYGHFLDYIGMYLVGVHFQHISVGVFAVSMLQYAVYYLLFRQNSTTFFWCFIAILLSFGWAHFMQSLNMLRQGLSVNLLIIFLLMNKSSYFFLIIHTLSHKISGLTLPILFIFRIAKFNYLILLIARIFIIIFLTHILPSFHTMVRGVDLTVIVILIVVISELFVLRDKVNKLSKQNLLLMMANTMITYFLVSSGFAYAERVFLSFFPVYFFVLTGKVKLNAQGITVILITVVFYLALSWYVGPLRTLT